MKASWLWKIIQPSKRGKLVQHEEKAMPPVGVQVFGQSTADLVEDEAHLRLGAADVGWRGMCDEDANYSFAIVLR